MPPRITLKTLLKDPTLEGIYKATSQLTTPQMHHLLEDAKEAIKGYGVMAEAETSPADFAHKISEGRWEHAPHLDMLSQKLFDMEQGIRKRLIVMMGPRHGKSEFISAWYPFWYLCRNPTKRVMFISADQDLADKYGRRVRNAVIEYGGKFGLKLDTSSTAAARWDLLSGGGMNSFGAHSVVVGRGADLLVCDDIVTRREDADSETSREKLWNWWQSEVITRLEPKGKTVCLGTRWHEDDLMGRLVRQSEGTKIKWDILSFPSIAEEEDQLGRQPGEPLWPARWPLEALEEIRDGMTPYAWSSLHQQRPSPEEGGAIKRAWFKWYSVPPAQFDLIIQSWDLAVKGLSTSDWWVGQVWGRKGAEFYLLDQVREHMEITECMSCIRNLIMRYPDIKSTVIEDAASGPAVIQMLQKELYGIIPWPPKGKKRDSKEQRLQAQAPKIESGNVYLPLGAPWVGDFVEEVVGFPNAPFDDVVDSMTQALHYLSRGGWSYVSKAHRDALQKPPPTTVEEVQKAEFSSWTRKRLKLDAKRRNRDLKTFQVSL